MSAELALVPASIRLSSRAAFVLGLTGFCLGSAALSGCAPLGVSIAAVFLFAGPHNWMEFRLFASRMPARWGHLTPFFGTALAGVLGLSAGAWLLPVFGQAFAWESTEWAYAFGIWNSALLLWLLALICLRQREQPGPHASLIWPAGIMALMGAWVLPVPLSLVLVYLHPLVALWFFDRELALRRPEWIPAYRLCLLSVPLTLVVLYLAMGQAPNLPGEDVLTAAIVRHAGGGWFAGVSTRFLVAAHVFLELLHYSVWIVAMPMLSLKSAPWKLNQVPLARRSKHLRLALALALGLGVLAVVGLWGGFLADYAATRDLYFTVAIVHVVAEFPFLIRQRP